MEVISEKKGKGKGKARYLGSDDVVALDLEDLTTPPRARKREEGEGGEREMIVLEAMQNELSCSVCFELFRDARRTACDHVYCR